MVLKEQHAREQLMSKIKAENIVHKTTQSQLEKSDDKCAKGLKTIGLRMILFTMGMTILFSPLTVDFFLTILPRFERSKWYIFVAMDVCIYTRNATGSPFCSENHTHL